MRVASEINLTLQEREALLKLTRSGLTSVRLAQRARIVLLASHGKDNTQVASELGIGRIQVGRWRERYVRDGMAAIERDLPRGGRRPTVDATEIVRLTTQTAPPNATHWSTRTLAQVTGVSATSVRQIWRARVEAAPDRDLQGFA